MLKNIKCYTAGGILDFRNVDSDLFNIGEIALSLSRQPRYNGHGKYAMNVAHHSVECYYRAKTEGFGPDIQYAALMHDTPEAYTGDLIRDIKLACPDFVDIEALIEQLLFAEYSVPYTSLIKDRVSFIDKTVAKAEKHILFPDVPVDEQDLGYPDIKLVHHPDIDQKKSKELFIQCFYTVRKRCTQN